MDNTTLNRAYLESLNACSDAIDFVERNNLVGFPVDRLNEVEGDYKDYVSWLKSELSTRREYDSNGNKTLEVDPDGSECRYEYDSNGNKTLEVNPDGGEYRWEYDSNGNKTLLVYPNGCEVSTPISYYDNGQLKSIGGLNIPQF